MAKTRQELESEKQVSRAIFCKMLWGRNVLLLLCELMRGRLATSVICLNFDISPGAGRRRGSIPAGGSTEGGRTTTAARGRGPPAAAAAPPGGRTTSEEGRGDRPVTSVKVGRQKIQRYGISLQWNPALRSLVRSPHHYGHPSSVPSCIPRCKLALCNMVTSPMRSLLPSPAGDRISEVPRYMYY